MPNKRFVCLIEMVNSNKSINHNNKSNCYNNNNKSSCYNNKAVWLLWPTRALKMQFILEKTMPSWNNVLIKETPRGWAQLLLLLLPQLLLACDKPLKAIS